MVPDVEFKELEEWKQIPGYTCYEASSLGRIRRTVATNKNPAGFMPSFTPGSDGRLRVSLYEKGKQDRRCVHQIIALTFIGHPPKDQEVRHADGNYLNNASSNLIYGTHKQNGQDMANTGILKGSNHPNSKLTDAVVLNIRELHSKGTSIEKIANLLSLGTTTVANAINRKSWSHI